MEGIKIRILRVNAIAGKTAAETVAAVMHQRNGIDDVLAVKALSALVDDAGDGTAGGNPHFTFSFHEGTLPFYPFPFRRRIHSFRKK